MLISGAVRRSGPSPRESKKKSEDVRFSNAVNKRFAELVEDWKLLMKRYGLKVLPRMPKDVKDKLRAEAVLHANQRKIRVH